MDFRARGIYYENACLGLADRSRRAGRLLSGKEKPLNRIFSGMGGLLFSPWRDGRRYMKIKQLSRGNGHPANVPAGGSRGYPKARRGAGADGTGDFDSARRGGPAL
jgi:hypothetical protein